MASLLSLSHSDLNGVASKSLTGYLLYFLFPYHSSVVQVPLCAFASCALLGFPFGASGIISLLAEPVNRFFGSFIKVQKIGFLILLPPLPIQAIFDGNDIPPGLIGRRLRILFQVVAEDQRYTDSQRNQSRQ